MRQGGPELIRFPMIAQVGRYLSKRAVGNVVIVAFVQVCSSIWFVACKTFEAFL